ncbi:MAG: hypothetical protein LBC97_01645 [Bifidobacteriaceae bacterium]|jgi:hypothetical protein|nr:hypothetical protein [Bifidobacteriaceae bacterium]
MSDWTNFDQASAALNDPNLPPAELAAIAAAQAGLRPRVAAHPNVYPDLVAWLRDQGVTAAQSFQAPAPSWPQQQPHQTEPQPQQTPQRQPYAPQQPASPQRDWRQEEANAPQAWAQPAPAAPQPPEHPGAVGGPGPWGQPPAASKPKRKRWVVPVAVGAAAIVLGAGAAGIVALTRDDPEPGADRQTQAPSPKTSKATPSKTPDGKGSESPAASGSASPSASQAESASADPGGPRSIQLVDDGDQVWYDTGETPYTGVALLETVDYAELGFILSADRKSLHDLTIRLVGGDLRDLSISSMTRSTTQEFDIVDGKVTCDIGSDSENVKLELSFALDVATGTLTFDFVSSSGQAKDLGSGAVAVSPADVD